MPDVSAHHLRPRSSFCLTIPGGSTDRTGLYDGDLVAIRAHAEPCDSKTIVARRHAPTS